MSKILTKVVGLLHTCFILATHFLRYVTYFTHFLTKVYKNNKYSYRSLISSTKKVSDWRGCGAKACKVCDASIKLGNNYSTTMQQVCFLQSVTYLLLGCYQLVTHFIRYVTYFTHFLIKRKKTGVNYYHSQKEVNYEYE